MSVATAVFPNGLYAPYQDRALSAAGDEVRASITGALSPQRDAKIWDAISSALERGAEVDGVDMDAFGRMYDLTAALPAWVPVPEIVVESDHEIGLDWNEGSRRVLSITVDETPFLGFAALFGHEPLHGRVPFVGDLPETLDYLFTRL